jgi:lysophospholipase L1-like esterase
MRLADHLARLARAASVVLGTLAGLAAAAASACSRVSPDSEGPVRIACVGDSITQASGWPDHLRARLGRNYVVGNFGVSGATALRSGDLPYWSTPQFGPSHAFAPDVVVLLLGTNDSKPQNWTEAGRATFADDYSALVDSYASLPSHPRIFVALPPPAGDNGFGVTGTVIEHEQLPRLRAVAASKGAGIVDLFEAFGGARFDPALFGSAGDQVHPGARGARVIADAVYAAVKGGGPEARRPDPAAARSPSAP